MRKKKDALSFTEEELSLVEQLRRHPELLQQIKPILDLAENTDNDLDANDIEDRLAQEVEALGNRVLGQWAKNVEEKQVQVERSKHPKFQQREKKRSGGGPGSEKSN